MPRTHGAAGGPAASASDGASDSAACEPGGEIEVSVRTLDSLVGADTPALIKIDVEGSELDVLRGARSLLTSAASPVVLFEHCGHSAAFGVTPAQIREFFGDLDYRIFLLDGALTPWDSDELPPTPNVVAARDVDAVRRRLAAPSHAAAVAPVEVTVQYLAPDVGLPTGSTLSSVPTGAP
jgi:hypothetical protein